MKVTITATPDLTKDKVEEIVKILSSTKGPIKFETGLILPEDKLGQITGAFSNHSKGHSLGFDDFFKVCDTFRFIHNTPDEEYVAALTSIENNKEWFSSFKNNNIFAHTGVWDRLVSNNPNYAIAHQIIENIFQSLIKINIEDVDNEPNIHKDVTGCINDYCEVESTVLLKFKTAEICNSCRQRAIAAGISVSTLIQIKEILEFLRKGLLDFHFESSDIQPESVKIDSQGNIFIGENLIELDPIYKTLFVFFLIHPYDRVTLAQLKTKSTELQRLYFYFKNSAETEPVDAMLDQQKSFSDKKNKLKKSLEDQLGVKMAKHYLISRTSQTIGVRQYHYHCLELDDSLISISTAFRNSVFSS